MCSVFSSPIRFQVLPPSRVLNSPSPIETLLRGLPSPVPTQTTEEFVGSIATAPIEATGWSSKTGSQVRPALTDFQTPPVAEPTQITEGSRGSESIEAIRPLIAAGPIDRALRPARSAGSIAAPAPNAGSESRMASARRRGIVRRMDALPGEVWRPSVAGEGARGKVSEARSGPAANFSPRKEYSQGRPQRSKVSRRPGPSSISAYRTA